MLIYNLLISNSVVKFYDVIHFDEFWAWFVLLNLLLLFFSEVVIINQYSNSLVKFYDAIHFNDFWTGSVFIEYTLDFFSSEIRHSSSKLKFRSKILWGNSFWWFLDRICFHWIYFKCFFLKYIILDHFLNSIVATNMLKIARS